MMPHGILAVWSDIDVAGEDDYNAWYDREHLFERLDVPGFHRGYHYVTVSGSPRYFTYFVTDNAAVMASQVYLAQANQPSPWTRRVLPYFRNTNRTACNVVYRIGRGYGGASLTIRLATIAGQEDELIAWLSETQLPTLIEQPGLIGAQIWRADRSATLVPVEDRRLRPEPDQVAELVVFVEGTLVDRLKAVAGGGLSSDSLVAHGGDRPLIAIHQLLNGAEKEELPPIEPRPG
jgi:hypothetical protein